MKNQSLPINQTTMEIVVSLHVAFNNYKKMVTWLTVDNPHFGGCPPIDLINAGRAKKVLQFLDAELDEMERLADTAVEDEG